MYWVYDKNKDEALIFGSIPALANATNINQRKLSIHFSEKKKIKYIDNNYRIERTDVIKSKRV